MDDLISRKRIMDEAKRLSGPMTGDGWDNWGVYALIERQPSVPAVPLDKLCEWLARNAFAFECKDCEEYCRAMLECENEVGSNPEYWKNKLTKWMEGLE